MPLGGNKISNPSADHTSFKIIKLAAERTKTGGEDFVLSLQFAFLSSFLKLVFWCFRMRVW
jgi:uncharacterized membrane protein